MKIIKQKQTIKSSHIYNMYTQENDIYQFSIFVYITEFPYFP